MQAFRNLLQILVLILAAGYLVGASLHGTGVIVLQNGAAPAATCAAGELFIDTDETDDTNCTTTADNSLCLCVAANTWTTLENN